MTDELVLATQKWLNDTYELVEGFDKVPENGSTGWATIYGLIEGLQVELGITELVNNFGPTTERYYEEQVTPKWGKTLPVNVVYLIQGAFWCKGIDPGGFDGLYTPYLDLAVKKLQTDAGFGGSLVTGILNASWAKALFDMSAFVLVPNGDSTIRDMQQWLNVNYLAYTGIMPCDGIYQRSTNTALIFALQAELGYSPDEATGTYGDGTTNRTYAVSNGDSGNYVKIVQYGLYANGYYDMGSFDGVFNNYMGNEVYDYRKFMVLPEYETVADVVVIKGLLSSAGDTRRVADGVDTSTQLTIEQIQTLVNNNVKTVGRYLTGTVGTGAGKRDKYMTIDELENIFSQGLSVFPIYQDGWPELDYFNYDQGVSDGQKAIEAAKNLNIPLTTTIYFAVDMDMLGGEIDSFAIQYFKGVATVMGYSGYQTGVYGTRNVCSQVIASNYATFAFISDMSTGYSGNLGFAMPRRWAFDQFIEFTMGSGYGAVGIDQVAVSGRDLGFSSFSDSEGDNSNIIEYNKKVIGQMARTYQYLSQAGLDNPWNPHLTFYRYRDYKGFAWDILASPITATDKKIFDDYYKLLSKSEGIYQYFIDPNTGSTIGLSHLIVTLQSQMFLTDTFYDAVSDFAGWLGDLMTCWGEVKKLGIQMEQGIYALVGTAAGGTFSLEDLFQDIDAVNVYAISQSDSDSTAITSLSKYYCEGKCKSRFNQFIKNRFVSSEKIKEVTNGLLENDLYIDPLGVGILSYFVETKVNDALLTNYTYLGDFIGDEVSIANGFSKKLIEFADKER